MASVTRYYDWLALGLGLLLGCRSKPAPRLAPSRVSASSTLSSAAPSVSATASASLQVAPSASAEPTSAASSASAPRATELATLPGGSGPGPFYVALIGSRDDELRTFSLGRTWLVGNYRHYVVTLGDELISADAVLRGGGNLSGPSTTIEELAGAWPDAVYARVSHSVQEATLSHSVHRHEPRGWVKLGLQERLIDAIAATADGRLATLYTEGFSFFLDFPVPGAWGSPARVGFGRAVLEQHFTQLFTAADATLFVVLHERVADDWRFLIGHFDPARDKTLEISAPTCPELPEPLSLYKLSNGADGKVHGIGRAKQQRVWATLEGSSWHCQKLPELTGIIGVAVSSTGVATLVGRQGQRSGVWQRSAIGDWRELTLPRGIRGDELGDFEPREVLQGWNEDLWLTGVFAKKRALLHSRPVKRVVQLRPL